MNVLLSIKPRFAELIFSGKKKYEFRKTIFSRSDIKKVIVYASSPTSKVIGEFEIAEIISAAPPALWKMTKAHAGISQSLFFRYFSNRNRGYAIKVKKCTIYESPLCIQTFFGIKPPQSFAYVAN